MEQLGQGLGIGGIADALLGDDAGDEGVVGHIKGGVVALDLREGHGLGVELLPDLLLVPQLNLNVVPRLAGEVNGGGGAQHIEGDAVVLGQNGHAAGANLVGRVAVGGHPVTAHQTGIDPGSRSGDFAGAGIRQTNQWFKKAGSSAAYGPASWTVCMFQWF